MNFSLFACVLLVAIVGGVQSYEYRGCYLDTPRRDISGLFTDSYRQSVELCVRLCQLRGFRYAGLQYA